MKIKSLTILLFSFICSVNFAQNSLSFKFAEGFYNKGHEGRMYSLKMITDSLGNHLVAGKFDGVQDLDPSSNADVIESLYGQSRIFLAKYSQNGDLLWEKTTDFITNSQITEIHSDGLGNIYMSGECSDSIDLGFNGNESVNFMGQTTNFLAKYTTGGTLIWRKVFKATDFHFDLNASNEIIAHCTYSGNIDMGNSGTPQIITGGWNNLLLIKFNSNGTASWFKSNLLGSVNLKVGGVGSDADLNLYVSGVFNGSFDADFDAGVNTLVTYSGMYEVGTYLCKYDPNGTLVWARLITGSAWVDIRSMEVNRSGEFAISAGFSGGHDFDVTSGQNTVYAGGSTNNMFLVKYDTDCNLVYVNTFSGNIYPGWGYFGRIVLTDAGHCHMLNRKQIRVYTENDTLIFYQEPNYNEIPDLIRMEFDSTGNIAHAHTLESQQNLYNENFSEGYAISLGLDGNPVVLGEATRYVDLDETSATVSTDISNSYFLASFDLTGPLNWASFIGINPRPSSENTTGVVFDELGGYFVTGTYRSQVDLDLSSNIHYSDQGVNSQFAYLSHFDQQNQFLWSQSFAGNVFTYFNVDPIVDPDSNVLVTLNYSGALTFNTSLNNYSDTIFSSGIKDVMFKFNNNGGLIWAKKIYTRASGNVKVTDFESTSNNEIYVTGTFKDTLRFELQGVDTSLVSNNESEDIFIARFDVDGELIWIRSLGASGTDQSAQILPDESNHFYLSGKFAGTVNFNLNGVLNNYVSPNNALTTFFASYSSTGNLQYVKLLSAATSSGISDFKRDGSGNIILSGNFVGTLDCDPSSASYNLTSTTNNSFLAKYTSAGQFVWAKSFSSADENAITSFIVDSTDNILAGGYYKEKIQFSQNPNLYRISEGNEDIFLVHMTGSGQITNVFSFGTATVENLSCVAYGNGSVGITGSVNYLDVDFDPSQNMHLVRSHNNTDGFIAKYELCTAPAVSILWNFITMTASVSGVDYQWIDAATNEAIPGATQQSFTPTEDGSYYVVISTADGCSSSSQTLDIVNLGLEEIQKGQITLYPNPTSSLITIKIENPSESYRVSVYSLSGAPVLTQTLNGNTAYDLDASDWSQGVYLIRLDSENDSQVFKIIKN